MRDHGPIILDKFNGLYARGDVENVPLDHFSDCNNIKYIGNTGFGTRDGIGRHQDVGAPLGGILRMYNYQTADKNTLLVLTTAGEIYHVVDTTTIYGPILTIPEMTDFAFVPYAGRAYITPFKSTLIGSLNRELGLQNNYVYVYQGTGVVARKIGGVKPVATLVATVSATAGHTEAGVHVFGYVYETDTGYLSAPGGLTTATTAALFAMDFSNVSVSPDAFVVKRHIVASKVIQAYAGDIDGYDLFFIPGATIPNNIGTTLPSVSFFDADLLKDAGHLLDNFSEVKAGVGLGTYHNRLVLWGQYDSISTVRVSAVGEPEVFSQIDGILEVPPDGNPVTNAAELRDVLYVMKRNKTVSFVDNGDIPSLWPLTNIDLAMGCGVHGIATVVDAGSSNLDYLIVATYTGLVMFNGRYILPELTWKVSELWGRQTFKTDYRRIQIVNDSVDQILYCILTDRTILYGNYANGFDPKIIRWSPWSFEALVNTIALININELILGMDQV